MGNLRVLAKVCSIYIDFVTTANDLEPSYKLKDGTSCFGFLPYRDIDLLLKDLKKLYNRLYKKTGCAPSFMDIGCGTGNILLLASVIGYKATGLEYSPKVYKVATKLCSNNSRGICYCYPAITPPKIIEGDMRKFKNYGDYDVLYYYQPMIDNTAMEKFSIELCKQMKPGAYLICRGTTVLSRDSKGFCRVGKRGGIWRKKPTKTET